MLRCIFAAMVLLLTLVEAPAGSRGALVVGVSNYEHPGRLTNTLNDANDMATALKRLGFDVETVLDPSRPILEAAVRRYGDRSADADVSLLYYSGHAMESAVELAKSRLAALNQDSAQRPSYSAPQVPQQRTPQMPPPQAPSHVPGAAPAGVPPDGSETASTVERARSLIAVGDILSARIILRRAYDRGDARAALELGGTFDPFRLKRLSVTVNNSLADAAQAHDWYVKAAELGSTEANDRLNEFALQNR
jgi:hypothetical protein